jgi:translation initiation factor IF-3
MQVLTNNSKVSTVQVIDASGKNLGNMTRANALALAESQGLDLVILNQNGNVPITKLMDYGKHKFQQQKNQRKQKQQPTDTKELNFSYAIGEHDYQVRKRAVERFMSEGHKVKATIKLKGREMDHADLAVELLNRLYNDTKEVSALTQTPKLEGRNVSMVLSPKS